MAKMSGGREREKQTRPYQGMAMSGGELLAKRWEWMSLFLLLS